ncbi:MAG: dephospho-CoA kinase [Firmicutes bacterium]|nr:dephospho-CoA kinase [Bacillota bacterium]MDH7496758.1 dephospho-CoA kinase [Bacillota bacterium]
MIIGLTGGIGSGKSLVASELARRGAFVVDVDRVARALVEPGEPALEAIIREFGPKFRRDDGTLDRRALGWLVFSDPEALARLNGIMFPRLREATETEVREAAARGHSFVVVDAAVLYEAGLDALVDRVIFVTAPEAVRVERIVARDGLSRREALDRVKAQARLEDGLRRADFVVDNSRGTEDVARQVEDILCRLAADTRGLAP